jgi:hypothetical protein
MWWCGKRIAAKLIRNPVMREAASSKRGAVARAQQWPDGAGPAQGRSARRSGRQANYAVICPDTPARGYRPDTANPITSVIYFHYRKARPGWSGTPVRRLIKIKS